MNIYIHTYIHICIYIHTYICVCKYVCIYNDYIYIVALTGVDPKVPPFGSRPSARWFRPGCHRTWEKTFTLKSGSLNQWIVVVLMGYDIISIHPSIYLYVYVYIYIHIRVCVCVCACPYLVIYIYIYIHAYLFMYIYIQIYLWIMG